MPRNYDNLIKHQFKKGQSGNPKGRPRKDLSKVFGDIPRAARDDVYRVLYHALSLSSKEEAVAYLQDQTLGKYGFVFQIAIRTLLGNNGWVAVLDIFDRLFGRPRQQNEITLKGEVEAPEIRIDGGDVRD
jgi:hypothetical protein